MVSRMVLDDGGICRNVCILGTPQAYVEMSVSWLHPRLSVNINHCNPFCTRYDNYASAFRAVDDTEQHFKDPGKLEKNNHMCVAQKIFFSNTVNTYDRVQSICHVNTLCHLFSYKDILHKVLGLCGKFNVFLFIKFDCRN